MPPTPPLAPPGSGAPDPRTPRALVIIGVVVAVLCVGVGVAVIAWGAGGDSDGATVEASADESPIVGTDAWDPRIEPLADFVADERGEPFLEPVAVRFLDDDDYAEAINEGSELTDEEVEELETLTANLQALGLVAEDVDLLSEVETLSSSGTLAYYDPATDVITVKGDDLDVAGRVTVVHELTHAWQDQQFDLGRMDDMASGQAAVLRTLAEGDATLVEEAYVDELTNAERREYEQTSRSQGEEATDALADVPDVLQASFGAPYSLGPSFVSILDAIGGNDEVDAAFEDPPLTDADLVDPSRWFDGVEPVDVSAPATPNGEQVLDEEEFGAVAWLITLGARIDGRKALAAVDGWAGDNSITYRDGDRGCAAMAVRGVDPQATELWAATLQEWADAGPAGTASVARDGEDVVLRTCADPAGSAPSGEGSSVAIGYASVRLLVMQQVLDDPSSDVADATCFADQFVQTLTPEEMQGGLEPAEQQRRGSAASQACGL
jgi:hypothetical protein